MLSSWMVYFCNFHLFINEQGSLSTNKIHELVICSYANKVVKNVLDRGKFSEFQKGPLKCFQFRS